VLIRFTIDSCALGLLLVGQSQHGVCAIFMGDDPALLRHDLQAQFALATLIEEKDAVTPLVTQIASLIAHPTSAVDMRLDIQGTAFQTRVWQALRDIPAGSTASYSDIATRIGAPTATRAVARACAANPLAVVIPCHRVVRRDGKLAGYRWGIARKQQLLARESQLSA